MKTLLVFAGLKIAEVLAIITVITILFYMGHYTYVLFGVDPLNLSAAYCPRVVLGIFECVGTFLLYLAVAANWKWAERLVRRPPRVTKTD